MKKHIGIFLMSAEICLSTSVLSDEKAHWSYAGPKGPEHWGELDPAFAVCFTGENQSPINLTDMIEGNLSELNINYKAGGNEILNNGHTIQVNYAPGSTITVSGRTFELKQFHFHSPSENTIEGYSYPMEAHLVHADKDGNLAVIAVMFKEGRGNAALAKAWAHMLEQVGEKHPLPTDVNANSLLPHNNDYYRFNGSLTTPPCSEGVWWLVMKFYNTASKEQLAKFAQTMLYPNNRPIQSINARLIVQ